MWVALSVHCQVVRCWCLGSWPCSSWPQSWRGTAPHTELAGTGNCLNSWGKSKPLTIRVNNVQISDRTDKIISMLFYQWFQCRAKSNTFIYFSVNRQNSFWSTSGGIAAKEWSISAQLYTISSELAA